MLWAGDVDDDDVAEAAVDDWGLRVDRLDADVLIDLSACFAPDGDAGRCWQLEMIVVCEYYGSVDEGDLNYPLTMF
jgi:hypothetical protein